MRVFELNEDDGSFGSVVVRKGPPLVRSFETWWGSARDPEVGDLLTLRRATTGGKVVVYRVTTRAVRTFSGDPCDLLRFQGEDVGMQMRLDPGGFSEEINLLKSRKII